MAKNNKMPAIRFSGYTDAWEQRKLESLFTKYEDKVNTPNSGYWRLGLRSHCKGTFHTYIDAGNELETAEMNRVKSGNFILNITFAWERALAVTNDEDQDKLVSHRFPQFIPNSDLVIDFFKHTLMDKRFKHHLELSSPGGAGRNKVLKVADMLKYELLVPSIKEQNEISSFLNHVDYIITLHQRKLEKLKLTKKALLQKLFPKNGSNIPELRFKGFTNAWEQRKLSDVADVRDGTHDSPKFYNDGFPLVTSKNLKGGSIDFSDCSFISEQDFNEINKRSKVDPGDILFGMIGTIGNPAIVEHTGFAIKNVALIKEGNIINNRFIYHLLSSKVFENYIARENAGGTQKFIALNQIRNFDFLAPTLVEQSKIIELLDCISQNLTLHQRKLEMLKNVKKGLLQKMFV